MPEVAVGNPSPFLHSKAGGVSDAMCQRLEEAADNIRQWICSRLARRFRRATHVAGAVVGDHRVDKRRVTKVEDAASPLR